MLISIIIPSGITTSYKFAQPVAKFSLQSIENDFKTAELEFNQVRHTKNSFEVRAFLNQPEADANTPLQGNDRFAGSLFFYGQGEYIDETGESLSAQEVLDRGLDLSPGASNVTPFNLYLDITDSLHKIVTNYSSEITVKLVCVDSRGNQITHPDLKLDSISLVIDHE